MNEYYFRRIPHNHFDIWTLIQIDNVLVNSENDFIDSRATREIAEGVLVVNTSAYFTFADMGAKMNSRDGLEREAEEAGLNITFGEFVQCADVNSVSLRLPSI